MITIQVKIKPTKEQAKILNQTAKEYVFAANTLIEYINNQSIFPKLSTKDFSAELPSSVKNEVLNTAKSVVKKFRKGKCESLPVLKKTIITWNNQNYKILDGIIEFPVWIDGKSKRIKVKAIFTEYQSEKLNFRLGSLRILKRNHKWIAQIAVDITSTDNQGNREMGIDLGIKIPAVAVVNNGKTKFFGNGRKNKYIKRKYRAKRKRLGKAKRQKAIKKLNNKEQRWMRDQDHKISKAIIEFAKRSNVSIIRLELLQNIRNTARTSRKNEKNLHTWSFYRLAQYIEYKANLAGIKVEYVDPKYTSQICPSCSKLNKAADRKYKCACGYKSHRDRVGAINIINAPVVVGNRQSA